MKLLFAGVEKSQFRDLIIEEGAKNVLASYFYLNDNDMQALIDGKFETLFLDSGGYTARKQNKEVNVSEYRNFLEKYSSKISLAANLDVLNIDEALENEKFLKEKFPVLPVFHFSEYVQGRQDLLDKYCKDNKYIAIGGMAGTIMDKKTLSNYLNYCFRTVMKYKNLRVHGFGITSLDMLKKYPFYTVDSTAWLTGGQYGIIMKWEDEFKMTTTLHPSRREEMIERNIPIKFLGDYKERLRNNIREILKMERWVTKLWALRGIKYE